jgi:hypothetical protein
MLLLPSSVGLKRKPLFPFSRKAKISENSLTFRFRKSFRENFRFRENFPPVFVSGYTFNWLLDPGPHSERKIFAKTFAKPTIFAKPFAKTKIFAKVFANFFATFRKLFSRKAKKNFLEIFAKIRKRKFSFQP